MTTTTQTADASASLLAFEDERGFERAALQAALVAGAGWFCAAAVSGSALLGARAAAVLSPALALCGAAGVWLLGQQRRQRALEAGEPAPARWLLLFSVLLGALAGVFAARALPELWAALVSLSEALPLLSLFPLLLRSALSAGACGAAFGLWLGAALLPLHLAARTSPVERRLQALRFKLGHDGLRPLAERVGAAHRGAVQALRAHRESWGAGGDTAPPLRTTLDHLALAALDQCARAAALVPGLPGKNGLPPLEQILARQTELTESAKAARDPRARAALERAAAAQGQAAERAARLLLARERLVASLHEQVAELEGARLSLVLLEGAQAERAATEVELLDVRLQAGCLDLDDGAVQQDEEPVSLDRAGLPG